MRFPFPFRTPPLRGLTPQTDLPLEHPKLGQNEEKTQRWINYSIATENRSKRLKQPCSLKCENRSATCHTECEKWLEYEKARNKAYEDRLASKEAAKKTYPSAAFMDKRFRK